MLETCSFRCYIVWNLCVGTTTLKLPRLIQLIGLNRNSVFRSLLLAWGSLVSTSVLLTPEPSSMSLHPISPFFLPLHLFSSHLTCPSLSLITPSSFTQQEFGRVCLCVSVRVTVSVCAICVFCHGPAFSCVQQRSLVKDNTGDSVLV